MTDILQIPRDGQVDFKNTVIIMTSNAGAGAIVSIRRSWALHRAENAKQDYEFMKNSVMNEVKQIFRPEFLNRIDETLVFHTLQKDEITKIAGLLLQELDETLQRSAFHSDASFTGFCEEMAG